VFLSSSFSDDTLPSHAELSRRRRPFAVPAATGYGDGNGDSNACPIHLLNASSARLANINVGGRAVEAGSFLKSQTLRNANDAESADLGLIGLAVM